MESLRAVVQGEFDTSPRLSLRWMTLADAPNPVAHIRTWGRSGGRRRSCYRFATARHGTGDTGRHRTTKPRAETPHRTAMHGTGRHGATNGVLNLHAGVQIPSSPPGCWRGASGRLIPFTPLPWERVG